MALAGRVTITGLKELDRQLGELPKALGKKIVRKAVREAARPVLADAKAAVPVDSGDLKKSLKLKAFKRSRKRPGTFGIQVCTRSGWFQGKQFYGGMVEFGHKVGKRTNRIKRLQKAAARTKRVTAGRLLARVALLLVDRRQNVKAYPFLGPAGKKNKGTVREIFRSTIKEGLNEAVREVGGKA
jgi:HK97 gp10 family phage protein